MKLELVPGVQAEVTFAVTEQMCPAFDGVVVHRVCSTWSLVQYMETAGRKLLVAHLEPGEEGVGSHASCDHIAPVAIGETVRVVATATAVTDRELVCDVVGWVGDQKIATGLTKQRVFPRPVLDRILRQAGS